MTNKKIQEIIDYLEMGDKFSDVLLSELDNPNLTCYEKRTYSSLLDAFTGATELYCAMSDWPDYVDFRIVNQAVKDEDKFILRRGPLTIEAVNQVSNYAKDLPLNNDQNNQLVQLMVDLLNAAEPDVITLNSNRLVVNSTNFQLDSAGNATFSGNVTGATITGGSITGTVFETIGTEQTKIHDGQIDTSLINVKYPGRDARMAISTDGVAIYGGGVDAGYTSHLDASTLTINKVNCSTLNSGVPSLVGHTHTSLYNDSGTAQVTSHSNNFRPHSASGDNTVSCGSPSYRWTQVYAATATISTSDRQLKEQEALITETEKKVAIKIKQLMKTFKYRDAVSKKGENARVHTGVIAQDVKEAFESEGLNPYDYALFCADTWYEKNNRACNDEEITYTVSDEGVKEVTRLGIRYEELLCFIIAAL